jgi:hypothetical protein
MHKPNLEEIEMQEAKKHLTRVKKKKEKMKMSGTGVKKLQKIIIAK